MALGVFQASDYQGQRVQRIGRNSAIHTGVKITFSTAYLDLGICNTAQAVGECWKVPGGHACIANEGGVTLQAFGKGFDVMFDRLASGLFLSFDEYTYI